MDKHPNRLTKIEVLLDKLNLLHTSLQAGDTPDKYELQLMRRYALQLVDMLDDPAVEDEIPVTNDDQAIPADLPVFTMDTPIAVDEPDAEPDGFEVEMEEPVQELPQPESAIDTGLFFVNEAEEEAEETASADHDMFDIGTTDQAETLAEEEDDLPAMPPAEEASLNDIFKQAQKDLADQLKEKPIQSLKQEIDLNEKFWFIQELFEGDSQRFNALLELLDQETEFSAAEQKVGEFVSRYDWQEKEKAAAKFMQLVQRRYM